MAEGEKMKKDIQPKYYNAKVTCATCGNTFTIGSTIPEIKVDTCSNCHSFYTGALNQVQATGRVERFNKKVQASISKQAETQKINEARKAVAEKKAAAEKEKTTKTSKK